MVGTQFSRIWRAAVCRSHYGGYKKSLHFRLKAFEWDVWMLFFWKTYDSVQVRVLEIGIPHDSIGE